MLKTQKVESSFQTFRSTLNDWFGSCRATDWARWVRSACTRRIPVLFTKISKVKLLAFAESKKPLVLVFFFLLLPQDFFTILEHEVKTKLLLPDVSLSQQVTCIVRRSLANLEVLMNLDLLAVLPYLSF